jgi:hypothetical protein
LISAIVPACGSQIRVNRILQPRFMYTADQVLVQ